MTITALRGSGALQMQYATIEIRNTAATSCWLDGYPSAQLRAGGRALGAPARPAHSTEAALRLRPGQQVNATLEGPTTCNAAVSDHLRVSLPHLTSYRDFVLPMRACPLSVEPFTRA